MSDTGAMQTPLIDLLRSVPETLRGHWASQWNDDGLSTGHTVAPVGMYCHQAADRISELEAENQRLRAVIDDMATDPMGEYHTGLRCGVEDRDIACRYEAAEYGWEQAFEYIGSIATGALLGGGE